MIIGGHQRCRILKKLGHKTAWVAVCDETITQEQIDELNIRLNRNSGEWDDDILANEWELRDLIEWGFTPDELSVDTTALDPAEEDDDALSCGSDSDIITKKGDIWNLGVHTLMCCDSSSMTDAVAQDSMVMTDPPYELDGKQVAKIIEGLSDHVCLITSMRQCIDVLNALDWKFHFDFVIDGKIPKSMMNRKCPYYVHQTGVYLSRDGSSYFSNDHSKGRRSDDKSNTGYWKTIIDSPRNTQAAHPHAKNLQGMIDVLAGFDVNNLFDPFAGSGTTLIAAERTERTATCFEIEPKYCDLIVDRYVKYCKKNNTDCVLLKNGEPFDFGDK